MKRFSFVLLVFLLVVGAGCERLRQRQAGDVNPPTPSVGQSGDVERFKDISYAKGCAKCTLDVYVKHDGNVQKPVLFFVHGGAWKIGNKEQYIEKGEFFAQQGYVFVAIGYPMYPEADYAAQATRVAQAFGWTSNNIKKYEGGDVIFGMGHSAGGHLISLISTDESYLKAVGLGLKKIRATISLDAGGLDIVTVRKDYPLVFRALYQDVFGTDAATLAKASPITHVAAGKGIPSFMVLHSTANDWSVKNANDFHKALIAKGVSSEIFTTTVGHGDIMINMGEPGDELTEWVLDFLERNK